MRCLLVFVLACGGGSSGKTTTPKPTPGDDTPAVAASNGCASAYAEYEMRWKTARSEELREVDFDAEAIAEVVSIEVAILPKKIDLEKLRGQYTAVAVFLPDSPWPLALSAADRAITVCGEETPRPT